MASLALAAALSSHAAELAKIEYLITNGSPDNDPGTISSWTPLNIPSPNGGSAQITANIPAAEMPTTPGTYLLAIRATDTNGLIHTKARTIRVAPDPSTADPNPRYPDALATQGTGILDYVEYVITDDNSLTDPGLGNGTEIPFTNATLPSSESLTVPQTAFTGLTPYVRYRLSVRAKDTSGLWSTGISRSFTIVDSTALNNLPDPTPTHPVTQIEAFITSEDNLVHTPVGTGDVVASGTPLADQVYTYNYSLTDLDSLPDGNYRLSARGLSGNGLWGPVVSRTFVKREPIDPFYAKLTYQINDATPTEAQTGDLISGVLSNTNQTIQTNLQIPNLTPGSYDLVVSVSDELGAPIYSQSTNFTTISHADYWDQNYFVTTAEREDLSIAGIYADPNNDGLNNLQSFLLGVDPATTNTKTAADYYGVRLNTNDQAVAFIELPGALPENSSIHINGSADLVAAFTNQTTVDSPRIITAINNIDHTLVDNDSDGRDELETKANLATFWDTEGFYTFDFDFSGLWPLSAWKSTTVSETGDVGDYSSLSLHPTLQTPHIAYYDRTNGKLMCAVRVGATTYLPLEVATMGELRSQTIIKNLDDRFYISSLEDSTSDLELHFWNQSAFVTGLVDGSVNAPSGEHDLALDAAGNPALAFRRGGASIATNSYINTAIYDPSANSNQDFVDNPSGQAYSTTLQTASGGYPQYDYTDADTFDIFHLLTDDIRKKSIDGSSQNTTVLKTLNIGTGELAGLQYAKSTNGSEMALAAKDTLNGVFLYVIHSEANSSTWTEITKPTNFGGGALKDYSLATAPDGRFGVVYSVASGLFFAEWNNGTLTEEELVPATTGTHTHDQLSLQYTTDNRPIFSYYDRINKDLIIVERNF